MWIYVVGAVIAALFGSFQIAGVFLAIVALGLILEEFKG